MEENTIELIDYLRIIWKRKILIIVTILVCIGVVVGVVKKKKAKSLPVTYSAEAFLKIGKKVRILSVSGNFSTGPSVEYIEEPDSLVESIPLNYHNKLRSVPRYLFEVERVGALSMIRLSLKGPDKGVEKILKELVDHLCAEHSMKAKDALGAYKNFMLMLEAEAENLKKEIVALVASIKDMKEKEGEHLLHIDSETKNLTSDSKIGDRSAFLNVLYLKTIDKENKLSDSRTNLRNTKTQLIMHQITLGNLQEYKTKLIGKIRNSTIVPVINEKGWGNTIAIAAIAGLIMSLFIAFFIEYIEEAKSKSKRNGKVDSA